MRSLRAALRHNFNTARHGHSQQPTPVAPKKLFLVGYPTIEQFCSSVALSEEQWQQVDSSFEHVLLAPVAEQQDAADNIFSTVAAHEQTQAAAAAVVSPHEQQLSVIEQLRAASETLFIICWHPAATEDASLRWQAFQSGANMVTRCSHALLTALQQVAQQQLQLQQPAAHQPPSCSCDWCGLPDLSPAEYWQHQQLYHINHPNMAGRCQMCGRKCQNLARHLHDDHDPTGKPPEHRTGVFALAIIRRPSDGRFLMTQEFAGSGYWIPGGGVDEGETLAQGAVRECWEEAGVQVELKGILKLECSPDRSWRRIIFWGEPADLAIGSGSAAAALESAALSAEPHKAAAACSSSEMLTSDSGSCTAEAAAAGPSSTAAAMTVQSAVASVSCCSPKTLPDWESAGACWVNLKELQQLPLRSPSEPCKWFPVVAAATPAGAGDKLPRVLSLPQEWVDVFAGFPCY